MKTKAIMLAATLVACGGYADTTELSAPVRIDGSVWDDGLFPSDDHKAAFCSEHWDNPDAWFCADDVGAARQAWVSSEYHGKALDGGTACYGPGVAQGTGDCAFPAKKKFRLHITDTGCNESQNVSLLAEEAMLSGLRLGAMEWDNNGGIDVSLTGSGSSYLNVYIDCDNGWPGSLATGELSQYTTVVANAPVGPHSGVDQDDLKTGAYGAIHLRSDEAWDYVTDMYGPAPTVGQIKSAMRYVGAHEMGHVLAFGHFMASGNLMGPFAPSLPTSVIIDPTFDEALSTFDPSGGSVTVENDGLQDLTPNSY